jgi:hypothetical protein
MFPLHNLLFNQPAPRFTKEDINAIKEIGDWYIDEDFSYIRIFGCVATPHLLPRYVPNKLVLREITYQTMSKGITRALIQNSKKV